VVRHRIQLLLLLRRQHGRNLRTQILANLRRLRLPIRYRGRSIRNQRLHLRLRLLQQWIHLLLLCIRQAQHLRDTRHLLLCCRWLRSSLLRSSLLRTSLLRSLCLITRLRLSSLALRHGSNVHTEGQNPTQCNGPIHHSSQ